MEGELIVGILYLVGLIICGAIVGSKKTDGDLVVTYKWMVVVPFALIVFLLYSITRILTESAPEGERATSLVEVKNENTEEIFYLNLLVDVFRDAEANMRPNGEDSYVEFSAYRVIGIISPNTGKLVSVDDSDSCRFGEECNFYIYSEEWDVKYSTTLHMKDVDASIVDRIKNSWLEILLELASVGLASYAGYLSVRFLMKNRAFIRPAGE